MDLATAQANLAAIESAYLGKSLVRSITIGDRTIVNPKDEELRAAMSYWQRVVNALTAEAAGSTITIATAKWES